MPIEIGRIQALCFDVDGTLSDTDDLWAARIARWLAPARNLLPDRDPPKAARRIVMGIDTPSNFIYAVADRLWLDDIAMRAVAAIHRRRPSRRRKECHALLIPGVTEMLAQLNGRLPMAVVSARDEHGTSAFLDKFELGGFFQVVASGQTCARTKPHPQPVLWAAEQMRVSPEACLMIGDTTVDIRAGRAAGAQTLGILSGFGDEGELQRAGADGILPSVADLPGFLLAG